MTKFLRLDEELDDKLVCVDELAEVQRQYLGIVYRMRGRDKFEDLCNLDTEKQAKEVWRRLLYELEYFDTQLHKQQIKDLWPEPKPVIVRRTTQNGTDMPIADDSCKTISRKAILGANTRGQGKET